MHEVLSKLGCLRAIRQEELDLMLKWRNSPSVRANMYTRHEISLAEHLAWWSRIQASADNQYLMYEYQSAPLGIVAFNGINGIDHNASWAFYASPEAPMGTGSKMEYLALEHAFGVIRLHKLCCEVLAFNAPVIKLHEKFGFKVECIFRDQHTMENSKVDVYRLGMLALEWHQLRGAMLNRLLHFSKS
jgi:UDP-4-amino-4,6-dideoxy-N-acetyl-beta-L-altrosamine N-acetyltransferase